VTIGGSAVARTHNRRTSFLPDLPIRSLASVYYAGRRFLVGGVPLGRFVSVALLLSAAAWATGLLPGRWFGVTTALILLIGHIVYGAVLKRRDYVAFHPRPFPSPSAGTCRPETLLPVYVTGRLSVEGKDRRFTALPGFYKTFATREHALLCLVRSRELFGVAKWPEDETGMWYVFFEPGSIKHLAWGALTFGPDLLPTIAVEYEECESNMSRFRKAHKENCIVETLYISSKDEHLLRRITSDLIADDALGNLAPLSEPAG
jgi:hypothetical protein